MHSDTPKKPQFQMLQKADSFNRKSKVEKDNYIRDTDIECHMIIGTIRFLRYFKSLVLASVPDIK